jgi:hypothetical protein
MLRRSISAIQKLKGRKNEMALPFRYDMNANAIQAIGILIGEKSIGLPGFLLSVE